MPPGTLYVVATPLGNLGDLTSRAVEVLRRAEVVACEDTRRTRTLLTHLGLRPPRVLSCHKFNERRRTEPLLEVLREGKDVALVTDGGTPGVSDPGALLVEAALEEGLPVSPVPGPSAVAAAVSACGFPAGSFLFVGFLPARTGPRRRALQELAAVAPPLVLFEAPHRLAAAAADMAAILGDRPVTLMREATKRFEEVRRTRLADLAGRAAEESPKGEITLVVAGAPSGKRGPGVSPGGSPPAGEALAKRFASLQEEGLDRREAVRRLVEETGLPRNRIYRAVTPGARREDPGEGG